MTEKGFREFAIKAANDHMRGDSSSLDLIIRILIESDAAKQLLRRKGYGWMGLGILKTAHEVPTAEID